jgi:hypothetical protein
LGKALASRLLGRHRYRVKDLSPAGEWSAEDDKAVVDKRVHEAGVLIPAVLIAQVARPIPRTTPLEPYCEEHRLKPYDSGEPRRARAAVEGEPVVVTSTVG